MADITSSDILNLSHSLKDVCEVDCETSPCLTKTLRTLLQWNLIQANLEYSRRFCCRQAQPLSPEQPQDAQFRHSLEHRHSFSHEHGTD